MAEKMVGNAPEAIRQARLKTMREKIHFLRESDGFEVFIPRFRLKKEHVNKLFGDEVEHVHDLEGNVILPDDYMWHCLPPPLKYFVYHRERVPLPPDDAHDPWYIGETQVVVTRAPADIPAHALVAWIRKGVERGDERYMQAKNAVNDLHEQLKRNKERQDNVPFMKTNAESEQGMAGERLYVTKELKKKRAELEDQLKKAQTRLDRENARRRMHEVTVECIRVDDKRKVTDWMAYFGTRREENAAIDMDQWPSVRVFHKMEKGGSPTAYWDDELEATDEILQDPDLEINMRGVQLRRIKHGLGAFTDWQRGDAYKGRFVEGKRHGQGILYDRVGVYRGEFEDDVRHGKGIQVFANGDVYEGPFEFDKMHGPDGVLKFADGSVYEGDFAIGTPTGQGTYSSHESCERIAGDFSDGVLHGIGLHTKPTGERCEGDFILGDLHGRGSWRSRKGDTCDGDFENGEPHGYARYNFRKGPMYDGFFRDGLRDGPGSMVYGNVSAVFDRSTGKHGLRHDFKYEGTWLAGRIQARNTHVTVHDRFLPIEKETPQPGYVYEQLDTLGFTTNSRSWARYPFLHALVHKEDSKREKRFLRSRALARREKKSLRQLRKRNLASFKQKRRDTIALFKRIDRALQSIHSEAEEAAQARREAAAKAGTGQASDPQKNEGNDEDGLGGGVMGGSKRQLDGDNANPQEYDEVSEYGGNGSGSGNGERSTSRNSNSNDRRETLSADDEDASYESGSSGDDDDDDEDEEYEDDDEDEEEDEDGDEWGYYDDSDWYSDEEDEDNEGLRTRAQNAASSLPKSMSSNPVYHDLRLSLVDIFEDPPPTDSKAGIISLRAALEYYAQREHKRKLEDLLRKRKSGSGG